MPGAPCPSLEESGLGLKSNRCKGFGVIAAFKFFNAKNAINPVNCLIFYEFLLSDWFFLEELPG